MGLLVGRACGEPVLVVSAGYWGGEERYPNPVDNLERRITLGYYFAWEGWRRRRVVEDGLGRVGSGL